MSRSFATFIVLAAFFFFPLVADARTDTVWDLRNEQEFSFWKAKDLTELYAEEAGLHIRTDTQGVLTRDNGVQGSIEIIEIVYGSARPTDIRFAWHRRGDSPNQYQSLTARLQATDTPLTLTIDPSSYSAWESTPDVVGFLFPAGAEVVIQKITLRSWNPLEKFVSMMQSFVAFDVVRPYTVNFLWGPLLAWNPVNIASLYFHKPPQAHSFNSLFYVILLFTAAVLIVLWVRGGRSKAWKRKAASIFLGISLGFWFLYDLRMAAEFMNFLRVDSQMFLSRAPGARLFRTLGHFPDFATAVIPEVMKYERYVFVSEIPWPYLGYLRYQTYPSLPVTPEEGRDLPLWLVYERPDIVLNAENRLENGQKTVLTNPGRILHTFAPGTFIFIQNP